MRKIVLLAAVAALSACSQEQAAETPDVNAGVDTMVLDNEAPDTAAETVSTAQSLHRTSWEFTMDGKRIFESIDEKGNYIADTADGEHYDHGTYVMKDGKACFTSAMNEDGEMCWTGPGAAIGETVTVTSDGGETLEVTRAEYRPLTMPS